MSATLLSLPMAQSGELTERQKTAIRRLWSFGCTMIQIQSLVGVSRNRIRTYLRGIHAYDPSLHVTQMRDPDVSKLVRNLEMAYLHFCCGRNYSWLARKFELSRPYVRELMLEFENSAWVTWDDMMRRAPTGRQIVDMMANDPEYRAWVKEEIDDG